jgi:hypothetical protein
MAHHSERIVAQKFPIPRGYILGGLAISSWALLIAIWSAVSASFSFILGV